MATLKIKYLATSVQMQMHLQVFLPESALCDPEVAEGTPLKALWLLHGEGGDCSDWTRLSMVEHYAQAANIALVMPNVDNSMYMDMAHGGYPYFTYLLDDLPRHVRHLVRVLSERKEDNFVAGVGTGGYGAVKWLLRAPQLFAGAACLSGDIDIVSALREKEAAGALTDDWAAAYGDAARIARSPDDVLHLLGRRIDPVDTLPPIHVVGNARDYSLERNRRAALAHPGAGLVFQEEADEHGWPLCNAGIRRFISTIVQPTSGRG